MNRENQEQVCCSMCKYWVRDPYANYCGVVGMRGVGMHIAVHADGQYVARLETVPDFYCAAFCEAD